MRLLTNDSFLSHIRYRLMNTADIRWWISLFFLVRLFNIWLPPIEISHNWRQVTGNMIARNFYEIDASIIYPRLDNGGQLSGITGTEFPLISYLHYLLSCIFGYAHWYGRLINLLVSSIGVYYFYLLVKIILPNQTAKNAAILLLASSWFMFSRKAMPDTFSTSLVLIGLYYAIQYLNNPKTVSLLYTVVLLTLGLLSKIPAAYLLPLLIPFLLSKTIPFKPKFILFIALLPGFIYVGYWYFYWVPWLTQHFGFEHYFMGSPLLVGIRELQTHLPEVAKKFYADAMFYIGFATCVAGFILAILKKEKWLYQVILPVSILFLLYVCKSGYRFYHHSYYIVTFVPVMCVLAAYALQFIKRTNIQLIIIGAIMLENIANQQHDFMFKQSEAYKLSLELLANESSSLNELIAINGGQNPQELYFTHRKGWTLKEEQLTPENIDSIAQLGCKLLFINLHHSQVRFNYPIVKTTDDYLIYVLKPK